MLDLQNLLRRVILSLAEHAQSLLYQKRAAQEGKTCQLRLVSR